VHGVTKQIVAATRRGMAAGDRVRVDPEREGGLRVPSPDGPGVTHPSHDLSAGDRLVGGGELFSGRLDTVGT